MKLLREAPIRTAQPSPWNRLERAEQRQVVRQRLAEADAGIDDQPRAGDAGGFTGFDAGAEPIVDVEDDIVIVGFVLHGARVALGMHQHDRQPGPRRGLEARGIMAQGRDVVDEVHAGLSRAAHHLGLARVDGKPGARAGRQRLDDGADAAPFLLRIDRIGAGPRRFPADVEDVGPLRLQLQRVGDGRIRRQIAPAVGRSCRA